MKQRDIEQLTKIIEYCDVINNTIQRYGDEIEIFSKDIDYQNSVSFSIMQIGEISRAISDEFKSTTEEEQSWKAIRGMRNLFAHAYGTMSMETIWNTAIHDIPKLKQFCIRYI